MKREKRKWVYNLQQLFHVFCHILFYCKARKECSLNYECFGTGLHFTFNSCWTFALEDEGKVIFPVPSLTVDLRTRTHTLQSPWCFQEFPNIQRDIFSSYKRQWQKSSDLYRIALLAPDKIQGYMLFIEWISNQLYIVLPMSYLKLWLILNN